MAVFVCVGGSVADGKRKTAGRISTPLRSGNYSRLPGQVAAFGCECICVFVLVRRCETRVRAYNVAGSVGARAIFPGARGRGARK